MSPCGGNAGKRVPRMIALRVNAQLRVDVANTVIARVATPCALRKPGAPRTIESPEAGFEPANETELTTYLFVSLAKVMMSPAATTPVPAVARGIVVWPTVNAALVEVALDIVPAVVV